MLNDDHKDAIRALYKKVSGSIAGFRDRYGQREMIGYISRALAHAGQPDGANIVAIEGRTGVGKTVGYLVPALVMSHALEKKLVLSTGTVALQEQLFSRDLPAVLSCLDRNHSFALLKGRGRFVCPIKLARMGGNAGQENLFGEQDASWDRKPEEKEIRWLRKVAEEYDKEKWNGEVDTLPEPAPSDVWMRIANNQHSCTGKKCEVYRHCPYFKSLDAVRNADIVVANHDLVLACISAESKLLPKPEESIYVFDEAHHLPNVALNRFANEFSTSARRWIERVPGVFSRLFGAVPSLDESKNVGNLSKALAETLRDLETSLRHSDALKDKSTIRYPQGQLDANFGGMAARLRDLSKGLLDELECMDEAIADAIKDDPTLAVSAKNVLSDVGFTFSRVAHFTKAAEMFAAEPADNEPLAKWVSAEGGRAGGFSLNVSPILAGPILRDLVWSQVSAAVLTSATITTLDNFEFFLRNAGLKHLPAVQTASVRSPFDYPAQGVIVLPRMKSDPGKPEEHTAEINQLMPSHLDGITTGALVLFASKKQMQAVHTALPPGLRSDVLMQGARPRGDLISTHIERVRSGQRSIIFGMASFGEGLDLPGDLCEHVLIAKIPFAPPDSPIEEAQAEWIESHGGNPFLEITLPKAGLTLIQWVGRLIRTESDTGRVVLFDTRLRTKRYGSQLLSGLPPFRREAA